MKTFSLKQLAFLPFYAFLISSWLTTCANAKILDDQEWFNEKAQLEEWIKTEKPNKYAICQRYWDLIWPWAKRGNKYALEQLMISIAWGGLVLPGRTGDMISTMRDFNIIEVHLGEHGKKTLRESSDNFLPELGESIKHRYIDCMTDPLSRGCSNIAVEDKLVPSLDDYASEIDMFLSQGKRPFCVDQRH